MQIVYKIVLAIGIVSMAVLAYLNQDSLQGTIDIQLRSLPIITSALVIILCVAVGTVILIPNSLLFAMTGALFGAYWGLMFNVVGFLIGSSVAFLLARYGFYELVRAKGHRMLQKFNDEFSDEGWRAVAVVRLTPIFPSFLVNYLLGITHIKYFDYAWASALFSLPGCVIFTYLGASGRAAVAGDEQFDQLLVRAGVLLGLLLALGIAGMIIRRRSLS